MVTIETPRLVLRPPESDDAKPLMDIHQDPDVIKYVLIGNPAAGITAAWRSVAIMVGQGIFAATGSGRSFKKLDRQSVGAALVSGIPRAGRHRAWLGDSS